MIPDDAKYVCLEFWLYPTKQVWHHAKPPQRTLCGRRTWRVDIGAPDTRQRKPKLGRMCKTCARMATRGLD